MSFYTLNWLLFSFSTNRCDLYFMCSFLGWGILLLFRLFLLRFLVESDCCYLPVCFYRCSLHFFVLGFGNSWNLGTGWWIFIVFLFFLFKVDNFDWNVSVLGGSGGALMTGSFCWWEHFDSSCYLLFKQVKLELLILMKDIFVLIDALNIKLFHSLLIFKFFFGILGMM